MCLPVSAYVHASSCFADGKRCASVAQARYPEVISALRARLARAPLAALAADQVLAAASSPERSAVFTQIIF